MSERSRAVEDALEGWAYTAALVWQVLGVIALPLAVLSLRWPYIATVLVWLAVGGWAVRWARARRAERAEAATSSGPKAGESLTLPTFDH